MRQNTQVTTYKNRAIRKANPNCVFFFPYNEAVGVASLHDEITGGVFDFATGSITFDGSKGAHGAFDLFDSFFTLPDLGNTKDFIIVLVADFTGGSSCSLALGNPAANGDKIKFSRGAAASKVDDGTSSAVFPTTPIDANTQAAVIYSDRANTLGEGMYFHLSETDGTGGSIDSSRLITAADEGINLGVVTADSMSAVQAPIVYGLVGYLVESIPTNVHTILEWCNTQWRLDNKSLPTHLIA